MRAEERQRTGHLLGTLRGGGVPTTSAAAYPGGKKQDPVQVNPVPLVKGRRGREAGEKWRLVTGAEVRVHRKRARLAVTEDVPGTLRPQQGRHSLPAAEALRPRHWRRGLPFSQGKVDSVRQNFLITVLWITFGRGVA